MEFLLPLWHFLFLCYYHRKFCIKKNINTIPKYNKTTITSWIHPIYLFVGFSWFFHWVLILLICWFLWNVLPHHYLLTTNDIDAIAWSKEACQRLWRQVMDVGCHSMVIQYPECLESQQKIVDIFLENKKIIITFALVYVIQTFIRWVL